MSRVGKVPVFFDAKAVQVSVSADNEVTVKGAKKTEKVRVRPEIKIEVKDGEIVVTRNDDSRAARSFHGLSRALLQNAVTGVSKGFTRELDLVGVGYRAAVKGKVLDLNLGYSHSILFDIPEGIEVKVDKQTKVIINGSNRELVGQVAAKIRDLRPPEPYLGKGVKYSDEHIRRKAGKSATK